MHRLKFSALVLAALCAQGAYASVIDVSFTSANTSNLTLTSASVGQQINIGDTVNMDFKMAPGLALLSNNSFMWVAPGIDECGSRSADFSWQALNHGVVVGGANIGTQGFGCVHMAPWVNMNFTGQFDEFKWSGTLLTSTTPTNTIGSFSFYSTNAQVQRVAVVPEPASLALFGLGMAGLAALRRRQG